MNINSLSVKQKDLAAKLELLKPYARGNILLTLLFRGIKILDTKAVRTIVVDKDESNGI